MSRYLEEDDYKKMLRGAKKLLKEKQTQLTSLEQTYAALTEKPSPTSTSNRIVYGEDYLDASPTRPVVKVPAGSTAAMLAEEAKDALAARASTAANPLLNDPYYKVDPKTGLSPAQAEAQKAEREASAALLAAKTNAAKLAATLGANIDPNTGKIDAATIDPEKAARFNPMTGRLNVTSNTLTGNGNTDTSGTTDTSTGRTTNVDVLKSLLRGMGFSLSLVDSSADFLNRLLKDGLDYDNAIAIFLDAKEYTFKNGNKTQSPFYASYGYLNEGLTVPKSAAELFNAVEGYKEVVGKYNLNSKYLSSDSLKKYVKNNVSVSELDERANAARLKAVNADKAYTDALQALGYIKTPADLTDFFLNPDIGKEALEQNRATAAFSTEAIRRAQQGVKFDATRFGKISAGLVGQGLSEAQIGAMAATGFETIGQQLAPLEKLTGIYERPLTPDAYITADKIQQELEAEQFLGTASERRKRLKEQEEAAFQRAPGTTSFSLKTGTAGLL